MSANCPNADMETIGYLLIAESVPEKFEDLGLPWRKLPPPGLQPATGLRWPAASGLSCTSLRRPPHAASHHI
jgi:hypothetical protein